MQKYIFLLISCLLICGACQEDDTFNEVKGGLSISLTDGAAETRSLPAALSDELKQQFHINLDRNRESNVKVEYSGLLKDFGTTRVLPVGDYKATASYGANKIIALDEPYYCGELNDILIEEGKAASITIGCKVANALATFTIVNPDNFNRVIKSYYVEIAVDGESVTWSPEDTTNPYFKAGSKVDFLLKGISSATNEELSYKLTSINVVEAGMKYNYKLKLQPSNVGFDITTETQKEPITINETIPEAWLPKAKLTGEGFDAQQILNYTETADAPEKASIAFTALRPVQDVELTLNFADSHYTHLNKSYTLSTLSQEDRQALTDAGIALPTLDETSTNGFLDFRNMTPSMQTRDTGESVDNQIKVKVKANNRWSDEGTYTIRTVKPNFEMGVYPGTIWTKEFSVYLHAVTGNANKIKELSTAEWSRDGSTWETIDKNTLLCTNLEPNTTYWTRTKYRYGEFITQEFKTYSPIALENGGLEGAAIIRGEDGKAGKNYGALYAWNNWGTLNALSAGYSLWTAYSFNSRSGSRPTTDTPTSSGNAVRIITLSYGGGGTDAKPKAFTHSELFLGTSADDNGNRTYGISHESRPTGVSFWYKCISNMNNDVSQVSIQLYHDEVLLGEGVFQTAALDNYTKHTLAINYVEDIERYKLIPNKLSLIFKSGIKENLSKEDLMQFGSGVTNKQADPMWRGNELFIDDVELIYDK